MTVGLVLLSWDSDPIGPRYRLVYQFWGSGTVEARSFDVVGEIMWGQINDGVQYVDAFNKLAADLYKGNVKMCHEFVKLDRGEAKELCKDGAFYQGRVMELCKTMQNTLRYGDANDTAKVILALKEEWEELACSFSRAVEASICGGTSK